MATYPETANSAVLYVLKQLETCDKHKLFKILYFAEMKHLVNYGRPIIETDNFVKSKYGPLLSGFQQGIAKGEYKDILSVSGYIITPLVEPDMDYLSKSEIDCLDESIKENKGLNFTVLTDKSHGKAWQEAMPFEQISPTTMALEAGANEAVIAHIREHMELRYAGW